MKQSYLVQRLEKPWTINGHANPFSFGGGLRNGGLSEDAMSMLREIFSFDYMGSAEFEWGAVPEALQRVAKYASNGELVAEGFSIPLAQVPKHFRDKDTPQHIEGKAKIYVICRLEDSAEVEERITGWARESYNPKLKESTHLPQVLRPLPSGDAQIYLSRVCGWLELDNGFMFFTDAEMWAKTCELFGLKVESLS